MSSNFIGSKIAIITKSQCRYVGTIIGRWENFFNLIEERKKQNLFFRHRCTSIINYSWQCQMSWNRKSWRKFFE